MLRLALAITTLGMMTVLVTGFDPNEDGVTLRTVLLSGICLAGITTLWHWSLPQSVGGWRRHTIRMALVGGKASAAAVKDHLEENGIRKYRLVGHVVPGILDSAILDSGEALGDFGDLPGLVEQHHIDLLLLTSEAPRMAVFEQLVRAGDCVRVRVVELSSFHEDVFRQVALAEINAAWFQYVLHPRFRPMRADIKRIFDSFLALVLGLLFAPLMLVVALLIRLDGRPVLFRQVRIGEKGRPFTLYKLRTMHSPSGERAVWSPAEDPRVTSIGRILRRFHLDELPQLYNVLRGDMSMVGPRPEQPELVSRLERMLPFYSSRLLIKPGLTGWAQVRAGYAASDSESARKLGYDLYYLKHQSLAYDLVILAETIWTVAFRRNHLKLPHAPLVTQVGPSASSSAAACSTPCSLAGEDMQLGLGHRALWPDHSPVSKAAQNDTAPSEPPALGQGGIST